MNNTINLLLTLLFACTAHCSWQESLRSPEVSPRKVALRKIAVSNKTLSYNQVPFMVTFDLNGTVNSVPHTQKKYSIPSIAKQMGVENQKIAQALIFNGKKSPRGKSFLVAPNGTVRHNSNH